MFNNRMLAIAAVLAMAVPALGAAAPIVVPPVPEQLVEGHTVFTVIEISTPENITDRSQTRFAAAVAVLVREYSGAQQTETASRFPGVLWFNDQYLVNPSQSVRAAGAGESFRYPCGGAVLAVNRGDPDPRVTIAQVSVDGTDVITFGDNEATYGPTSNHPGTQTYGNDYRWIDADVQTAPPGATVYSDTVLGTLASGPGSLVNNTLSPWDYRESYLITDPNDHSWVIDKYNFYTRDGTTGTDNADNIGDKMGAPPAGESEAFPTANGGTLATSYAYPVWVVNMLGSPVFLPDDLATCVPFADLLTEVVTDPTGTPGGPSLANLNCGGDVNPPADVAGPTFRDDPCAGYQEPSDNGFCYGGQDATAGCGDETLTPKRYYNALLYFKLQDLYVAGAVKDHSDPAASPDTNGCQTATEWECPGGNDDLEGNSHPFHPTTPPAHTDAEACLPQFAGTNPTNHGGSTFITGDASDAGWYGWTPCDYSHGTRDIDLYFNGAGRPFPPVVRDFDVIDLEGSSAPFQDYETAYGP